MNNPPNPPDLPKGWFAGMSDEGNIWAKPTPTPWVARSFGFPLAAHIRAENSADGPVIIAHVNHSASYDAKANAEHIVKCVNNFEALLEGCKAALAWMEIPGNGQAALSDNIRRAIARAEGSAEQ